MHGKIEEVLLNSGFNVYCDKDLKKQKSQI